MSTDISQMPIIDIDTHISEPEDVWTSRLPAKWHEDGPHVVWDERRQIDRWVIGNKRLLGTGNTALSRWHEFPPSFPPRLSDADPAAWDAKARVERMDEYGIAAQAVYPNLLGFHNDIFMKMERDLGLACVSAYNDFLSDFASVAPERFIQLAAIPFWDVRESVAEMTRAHELGHRGLLLASSINFTRAGLPALSDPYWEPILSTAQDMDWTVNFHVGFARPDEDFTELMKLNSRWEYAKSIALSPQSCMEGVAEVAMSGVCHRYPALKFVSVESGAGWFPFIAESLDWQWINSGAGQESPERELPSFYFKRQIYGSFWFEQHSVRNFLDVMGENLMFETDFPHPTSLSPGPNSSSKPPREMAASALRDVPEEQARNVLAGTAARLYHVDLDAIPAPATAR